MFAYQEQARLARMLPNQRADQRAGQRASGGSRHS
jgi:hypothetical protein